MQFSKAYWEAIDLSYEIQLKILQTLPALLQLYDEHVSGSLLARVLDICATLSINKTALVASSAGATLDQLLDSVFEQAENATKSSGNRNDHHEKDDDAAVQLQTVEDACNLFVDLCMLLNGQSPEYLATDRLPPLYLLRVLENVLDHHVGFIRTTRSSPGCLSLASSARCQ